MPDIDRLFPTNNIPPEFRLQQFSDATDLKVTPLRPEVANPAPAAKPTGVLPIPPLYATPQDLRDLEQRLMVALQKRR